jgi:hypothetical protein
MKTFIFLLRIDSVTGKGEGEYYHVNKKGINRCDVWTSPKLTDQEVIIATGSKAIAKIFKQYQNYHITEGNYHYDTN